MHKKYQNLLGMAMDCRVTNQFIAIRFDKGTGCSYQNTKICGTGHLVERQVVECDNSSKVN